jgi:cytochrome P450
MINGEGAGRSEPAGRGNPDKSVDRAADRPYAPGVIRLVVGRLSAGVIAAQRPLKVVAYHHSVAPVKRLLLEATTFVDWALIWPNIQNGAMRLYHEVYGGNFFFGKAVMITDHATTKREIACPAHRGERFMGVDIVSSDPNVFATNTGILNQNPPIRAATRAYLDEHVFTPDVMALSLDDVQALAAPILAEWQQDDRMATMLAIRATVTRVFLRILTGVTISAQESDTCTRNYVRGFTEASLFHGYAPWMLGLLGTHERLRKQTYAPLERHGMDLMAVDVTMFAAMFSVGTLVLRCVEDTRRFGIRYRDLDQAQRRALVFESIRLFPTVTTVHRRLTEPEDVQVLGRTVHLEVGDEIAYPFVCANRDPSVFADPDAMDLGRSEESRDEILSWSKGPHACPAKDLSVHVTMAMLDVLSERFELSALRIVNPQF